MSTDTARIRPYASIHATMGPCRVCAQSATTVSHDHHATDDTGTDAPRWRVCELPDGRAVIHGDDDRTVTCASYAEARRLTRSWATR